jgi:uncharacterized repeat protein (TIGR02543 family)
MGVYVPAGTFEITDGSISGKTGIAAKGGKLTISGGTITGTGDKADLVHNGNGWNSTGDGLAIESCGYPFGPSAVSITGGIFKSTNASAVASYATADYTPVTNFISGGKFSSDPSKIGAEDSDYIVSTHKVTNDSEDTTGAPYTVEVAGLALDAVTGVDGTKTVTLTGSFADTVNNGNTGDDAVEDDTDSDGATATGSATTTTITVDAATEGGDTAATVVNIPAATVGSLTNEEKTTPPSVTVKTDAGTVELNSEAMKAIIAAASTPVDEETTVTKDVSISLTKTTPTPAVGAPAAAYDVDVEVVDSNGLATEPLAKGNTANAEITLTLPVPTEGPWYIYYALTETGGSGTAYSPLELKASSTTDTPSGTATFTTNHLSTYIQTTEVVDTPEISAFNYANTKDAADKAMLADIKAVSTNPGSATTPDDYTTNTMWTVLKGLDSAGTYTIKYYYNGTEINSDTVTNKSTGKYLAYFSFDNATQVAPDSLKEGEYTCKLFQTVNGSPVLIETKTLNIYDNQSVVDAWTNYASENNALKVEVPGSDMLYNEVLAANGITGAGYTALWKAAGNEAYTTSKAVNDAVKAELATQKTALMRALKDYVQYLLNTIYNSGKAYTVGSTNYYLPTAAYETATQAIQNADEDDFSTVIRALTTAKDDQFTLAENEKLVTVTLDANGGKFADGSTTKTVNGKDSVTLEGVDLAATRTGYTLKGWYTAASGGTAVTAATSFTEEATTIYAQWTAIPVSGGSSSSSYAISVASAEGGKVTASASKAAKDTEVTLTVTAEDGKELDTLTVTDASGNKLDVTKNADGTYSFTMPASKVTVTAAFKDAEETKEPEEPAEENCPSKQFTDVDTSKWYHESVDYVVSKGVMEGNSDGTFTPNGTLTRAQLAQILYNAAGKPEVTAENPFTDVPETQWYAKAVIWAAQAGVVEGYGDGKFGPTDKISRQDLAVMLWRYAGEPAATQTALDFTDAAQASDYATAALLWASETGIVQGDNGKLSPKGSATRAEAATMIMRYLELA